MKLNPNLIKKAEKLDGKPNLNRKQGRFTKRVFVLLVAQDIRKEVGHG